MRYRIMLVVNKKKRKVLFKTTSHDDVYKKYREIIKNNKVDIPKKYTNYNAILPIKNEILILKERGVNDKNRIIRDGLGKLVEEKNDSKKWVIIDSSPYKIEETFWVYGYDSRYERFTVRDIIKRVLMKGIRRKNQTKQIIVVTNKLLIRGDELDIVICKCPDDCLRLYNKLKEVSINSNVNNLLFMGIANKNMRGEMYDLIQEKTGWNKTKVWRTTTRP